MLIPLSKLIQKHRIQPKGIIHIGASSGQEAKDYFDNGIENVIFFEAIPAVYDKLVRNLNYYPRMIAVNECIGDEDGKKMTFNISNNEAQSSSLLELDYHKTDHPEVYFSHTIPVVTKRIDTWLKEHQLSLTDYDFLNIDLQGAELMALKGIGEELKHVKYAYIEVNKKHEYKDCPLLEDIDAFMWLFDFERVQLEWCGGFSWGDAFYLKKEI